MSVYRDEIFGPVLVLLRADTFEEALELVNRNPYGNGAAIFTTDGRTAREFEHRVQAGMVGVNVPIPVPMAYYSFGGWKQSLFGDLHVHGREGVLFYTRGKVVTERWPEQRSGADYGFPTAQVTATAAAVIFDCDGTLVDSEPLARVAWDRSLAPYGLRDRRRGVRRADRPAVRAGARASSPSGSPAWPARTRSSRRYSDELFELYRRRARAVRGRAGDRARRCARRASRSPSRRRRRARGSTARSPAPGSRTRSRSPSPATRSRTASRRRTCSSPRRQRLGVAPADCAVVEDSGPGVAAGLAAGMRTVGDRARRRPGRRVGDAHVVLERLSADAVLGRREGASASAASRAPSRSAANAQPASSATAATSIGASGSVASTTSAPPGGTPASARRALTAGSGQARPRASSVVSIRSVPA